MCFDFLFFRNKLKIGQKVTTIGRQLGYNNIQIIETDIRVDFYARIRGYQLSYGGPISKYFEIAELFIEMMKNHSLYSRETVNYIVPK